MKKNITLLLSLFLLFFSRAQNLVPNNGFDIYTSCPNGLAQFTYTPPWSNVNNVTGTPDYFNVCGTSGQGVPNNNYGYQQPVSGSGYYALITYYDGQEVREYMTVPLISSLANGATYSIGIYVSLSYCKYATDHFGIHLSNGILSGTGNLSSLTHTPQIDNTSGNIITDDINWTLISGTYTATGGESYLTVGNFSNDSITSVSTVNPSGSSGWAYYYVDEAFVIPTSLNITGNNSICIGDSVTLKATGDTSYAWANSLNPGTIISTDSVISISPSVNSTYIVYGINDTISFTINVTNFPIIDLGNDTTICQGTILTLDATTQNASYLWNDSSYYSKQYTYFEGTYWVEVNANGCISSDTIFVEIFDTFPQADFKYELVNFELKLKDSSSNDVNNWYWTLDGDSLSILDSAEIIFSQNGVYEVCLMVSNNCFKDTICKQITISEVGINEVQTQGVIKVYPNPVTNQLTIELKDSDKKITSVQLIDVSGRVVSYQVNEKGIAVSTDRQASTSSRNDVIVIDVSRLTKGLYIYEILSDEEILGIGEIVKE